MKKVLVLMLAVLLTTVLGSTALAAKVIPESQVINAFDLEPALSSKVLIDVRLMEDIWQDGEIAGSVRIGLHSLLASDKLPAKKDAAIVVVSQDGDAGELAVLGLSKLGYTNVQNLDGGVAAWKMVGMSTVPVERTNSAPVAGGC